ncbi:hypothetical protein [Planomonospora venezuelensis]|uniref:Uncharacterized protein n=1 Tax=Planomonospora venezuelensis TaxID=1999 RepID=A0A841D6L5_PLAVE|nr:hypothetical protein [Planomonospora venezuelensis]MBB5965520.1 hypothetical protein [Planomonospora venezuelensis]GIN03049.1 hypothetical protein Pve01_47070 [Planomonospora venezuelensis]
MSTDEIRTVRLTVEVEDCGVAGLADEDLTGSAGTPAQSAGIIKVEDGFVTLDITHQWGPADFAVTVADRDPGADLAAYEDIVEISYVSTSGRVAIAGFSHYGDGLCPLPPLPAGAGTYRIRYHVKGMDSEGTQDAVADHYLQIWPAPLGDPVFVKTTTEYFRYSLDPKNHKWSRGER